MKVILSPVIVKLLVPEATTTLYDSEDEATLDADSVIADDSELAEFEGISTVTVTVAPDPDAKVTELSDLAEAQTHCAQL